MGRGCDGGEGHHGTLVGARFSFAWGWAAGGREDAGCCVAGWLLGGDAEEEREKRQKSSHYWGKG
jgi:hypothetical protein